MEELPVLLDSLKSTVECLTMSGQTNTWEVCGGLERLHSTVLKIFQHECLSLSSTGHDAVWNFIQKINWLHPTITTVGTFLKNSYLTNEQLSKSSLWIYKSLENHTLSEKLGWLLSDIDHLHKCYKPEAFLCQEAYRNAALLCLKAVELNQPSLLLEIDPKLYLNYSSKNEHCTTLLSPSYKQSNNEHFKQTGLKPKNTVEHMSSDKTDEEHFSSLSRCKMKYLFKKQRHKSWPDIYKTFDRPKLGRSLSFDAAHVMDCSSDFTDTPIAINKSNIFPPKLLDVNYEQLINENIDSNKNCVLNDDKILSHSNFPRRTKRRSKLFTLPVRILEESDDDTRSNISDGSRTLIPYDEFTPSKFSGVSGFRSTYFPGQDLFKFLSSGQFVQANAELDRENAHFKISEAIIGTIEQIKCNQHFTADIIEESDEEINRSKQKIRFRRKKKNPIELTNTPGTSSSDYLTESTATDHTMSSLTSSYCSTTSSLDTTTDDMDDFDLDCETSSYSSSKLSVCSSVSNLGHTRSSSTSSMASMVTAESVARSLIRHIRHKNKLPVDENVQWLISESDAPQEILPLPSSWPVNPHEPDDLKGSRLRGTNDWAPPRPQIIFTCHPPPIRKNIMEQQGYRCAGCSMQVAVKYASKFRYCFYLGRYFCTGCHLNKTSIIPGRIIAKWDFSRYPVSCFSFALLEQMVHDPLFDLADLNSVLYKRARGLDKVRTYRLQLFYIKDFIFSCRYANKLKELLDSLNAHLVLKPDLYSIQNMIDVRNGELGKKLQNTIMTCVKHISNCQLCQARGFVCEICNKNEVLFPWDFRSVTKCSDCGTCSHKKCYELQKVAMCPRCPRIKAIFKRSDSQNDQNVVIKNN